jgi:hypothetical protein
MYRPLRSLLIANRGGCGPPERQAVAEVLTRPGAQVDAKDLLIVLAAP